METPLKIAVVDDKLRDAEQIAYAIHKIKGCSVVLKETRPIALFEELLATKQLPDVLITDYQMPHLDGIALTQLVQLFLP